MQKQSWVMLNDRQFHYQVDGKALCNSGGVYGLFEEINPPKKYKCKQCLELQRRRTSKKNCQNCKRKNLQNNFYCIPCKRGTFVRDNWVKQ